MKKKILGHILLVLMLALIAGTLSSCNKGYGCPTNFKVTKVFQIAPLAR
jgi:predicted small secreted protein